jgi:lysyl-tRNA synthetase class 2
MTSEKQWQPSASIKVLRKRAEFLDQIRLFFKQRHYLEVDTPCMAHYGVSDVYLANIKAIFRNRHYCLQTSPEYHMKRLLAAGSGPVFQLARAFRDDELGRWHNPEFTLLEWYQLGIDHHGLMDEVDALLQMLTDSPPLVKKTYRQVFIEACQLDPWTATIEQYKAVVKMFHLDHVLPEDETDQDQYLFLLMSHVVEPFLAKEKAPVAVYDFPISQAALAKVNQDVAERFEVYFKGVELANGFHELTDARAQAQRFNDDIEKRGQMNLPLVEGDPWLLSALEDGLPPCSGVALGVDRLLALALGYDNISAVLSFDWSRA